MPLSQAEAERDARAGLAALQRGDGAAARPLFAGILAAGHRTAPLWLLLARSCRLLGDEAGETDALDRALALEPRNLRALVMRGEAYTRAGDTRAATSFYQAALAAAKAMAAVPAELEPDLRHAQAMVEAAGGGYQAHLEASLAAAGLGPETVGPRFGEALDILCGRRQIYFQQPSAFYFPRLPQIQFYEREQFAWVPALEAATAAIRDELLAILAEEGAFVPYVQAERDRPHHDFHGLLGDPSWGAFYLIDDGRTVEANAARCPRTMAALAQVPLTQMPGRTPSVLFSLLRPGTRIPPHTGMLNTRLICHLPLIVPDGCALRVGNETRPWRVGETLIFDDSIEHEAWNSSDRLRVILLFDIWRPELSEPERRAVAAIFAAIDAYRR
ncbi:MAG TPA: aspartyl/asparaginyl beta-hydroxylase domain-containing protein [Allosphingosinicella sp.]|nr:aspartyl/asparaginyl beta-hydroxylase domain-containing protein [Allosphingosinicella sp.]